MDWSRNMVFVEFIQNLNDIYFSRYMSKLNVSIICQNHKLYIEDSELWKHKFKYANGPL